MTPGVKVYDLLDDYVPAPDEGEAWRSAKYRFRMPGRKMTEADLEAERVQREADDRAKEAAKAAAAAKRARKAERRLRQAAGRN